jgi:hypothetical protein
MRKDLLTLTNRGNMKTRMKWKYFTKNGRTFLRPSLLTCPFSIEVNLSGGKHKVIDVRLYQNGGSTAYRTVGESYNILEAQTILRTALKQEQTA